jgi:hypothetical protein
MGFTNGYILLVFVVALGVPAFIASTTNCRQPLEKPASPFSAFFSQVRAAAIPRKAEPRI